MTTRPARRPWSIFRAIILVAVAIEVVACVVLYFAQDALILPTRPLTAADVEGIQRRHPVLRAIATRGRDGTQLQGWLLPGSDPDAGLIVYFGGQGGEASGSVMDIARHTGWSVIGFNYRGCGLSQGRPTEERLFADALAVYESARHQHPRTLVALGKSLGSGVAVYCASQRPMAGVILITPYDSIASVAQEQYPFVPVSLLIKYRSIHWPVHRGFTSRYWSLQASVTGGSHPHTPGV